MLDYVFQFIAKVYFYIGAANLLSQAASGRLEAEKTAEEEIACFGEAPKLNYVYRMRKERD